MQPPAKLEMRLQNTFGPLPVELFLNVLDHLVGTRDGQLPIAYSPSHPITKALRALTLVSRTTYLWASRYLYAHCLYLDSNRNYSRYRRTMGIELLPNHPENLDYGQAGRNEQLFAEADIQRHITSLFISPSKSDGCQLLPQIRLPQIVDLCLAVGSTLKRLAIDFHPVYIPNSELLKADCGNRNIFLQMPHLEELICSYDTSDYFRYPPPNLKRLAMTSNDMEAAHLDFFFSISSLDTIFLIRPKQLTAAHINQLFSRYHGRHVDIVFVDVSNNHATPRNTRDWTPEDRVTIWEADVPISFYGDDEDLILCDAWIWSHGVGGDLCDQHKRRMLSWSEVQIILTST